MDKWWEISDEEYKKICNAIPHKLIVSYYKKYPKEYSRLCKFRATSLSDEKARSLLLNNRNNSYIFSFIRNTVERWIKEIEDEISSLENAGKNHLQALVHALSQSFLSDNVSVFFQLTESTMSNEEILCVAESVSVTSEIRKEENNNKVELSNTLESIKQENSALQKRVEKQSKQIKELNKSVETLLKEKQTYQQIEERLTAIIKERDSLITDNKELFNQCGEQKKRITSLQEDLTNTKKQLEQLEKEIRDKIEEEQKKKMNQESFSPFIPTDLDDFKDFFQYNLESIGINNNELMNPFISYIPEMIFEGFPIVCQMRYSAMFAKCVSNSLIGTQEIPILYYTPTIKNEDIVKAILQSTRIIILRNFLGNYDEIELIALIKKFSNKIIIIDYAYNQTLQYLPLELFEYCIFLDLSKFPVMGKETVIEEDSAIQKEEINRRKANVNMLESKKIIEIMRDLNYKNLAIDSIPITSEELGLQMLLFSVLPLWSFRNHLDARNQSEKLQTYIKRSHFRTLINNWFDNNNE